MARRIVGVVLAVALAALGTVVLVLYVQGAEERALAGEETVEVLVVDEAIDRGSDVTVVGDSVRTEQIPVKVQAQGSVADLEDLDGQVANADLVPGEQITTARFIDPDELARTDVDIPEGMLETTISLSSERAIGGQIVPGSTVALLASFDSVEAEDIAEEADIDLEETESSIGAATHLILHKVLVTNVQYDGEPGSDGEEHASAPSGDLLVTVALDAPAIERVVFVKEFGRIWLALEPEDAPEEDTRIQTRGQIFR